MNTLTATYTITQTRGGRGFRVNLVRMGESHVMYRDTLRARCVYYIEKHARNGVEAAVAYFNANPADRPAKHERCCCPLCMTAPLNVSTAAAMRADMRDRDRRVEAAIGLRPYDEEYSCRVCHEPVAEDEMDVDGNRPDLHFDCVPEFEAERAEWKHEDYIDRIAKEALNERGAL